MEYYLGESAPQRAHIGRGTALNLEESVPVSVLEAAQHHHRWRRWELDLVRGGVAPIARGEARP
jgi:hypothetical protein